MVFNVDSPSYALSTIRNIFFQMKPIFQNVFYYQVFQPTYLSGHYSFIFLSDFVHPFHSKINWKVWEQKKISTVYYNKDIHYAAFVLPNFVRKVLTENVQLNEIPDSMFKQ